MEAERIDESLARMLAGVVHDFDPKLTAKWYKLYLPGARAWLKQWGIPWDKTSEPTP